MGFEGRRKVAPVCCQAVNSEMRDQPFKLVLGGLCEGGSMATHLVSQSCPQSFHQPLNRVGARTPQRRSTPGAPPTKTTCAGVPAARSAISALTALPPNQELPLQEIFSCRSASAPQIR